MPKAKKSASSLGKSLINKKRKQEISRNHTAELFDPSDKLKSVIDQSTLKDFLQEVELSSRNFEAVKETKIRTEHHVIDYNTMMNLAPKDRVADKDLNLRVPRRPKWDATTTPEQLTRLENDSFLDWRRNLANIEEVLLLDRTMTPFEKNLEVWKQLWRVVEKADIVVQVVDGRNPMFFRCPDLENYVKELDPLKENILLINKSDLLSDKLRNAWNDYLNGQGVNHIFFSAKKEQEKIDTDKIDIEEAEKEDETLTENTPRIFTRKNLLSVLQRIVLKVKKNKVTDVEQPQDSQITDKLSAKTTINPNLVTIGMVGYPNVGKSSVINVLCKKKLVGVAAQPGKTKHFQTLFIEKDLLLCDCPGLVFPNFTSNRSEMVCNGVLPIDKLRDYQSPIQYLCLRIPKHVFEKIYKIKIDVPNPTASQVLQAYSKNRGHLTGRALPDETKASRIFLKDLVNGKLLCCEVPPEYDQEKYGRLKHHDESLDDVVQVKAGNKDKAIEESKNDGNTEAEIELDKDGELVEKKRPPIDDDQFFDEQPEEEDDPYEGFDNEDLLMMLLEGKPVRGVKLNKDQRREIKFAIKRGENIDVNTLLKKGKPKTTGVKSLGVHGSESYMRANIGLKDSEERK